MSDGMFLSACREVAKAYPDVAYDEDLLDRVCLQVSKLPAFFFAAELLLDCPKSQALLRSSHGYAKPIRRHSL